MKIEMLLQKLFEPIVKVLVAIGAVTRDMWEKNSIHFQQPK